MIIRTEFQRDIQVKNLQGIKLPCKFRLEKIHPIRTLPQNRLYWANIGLIVYELAGGDKSVKDSIHNEFKEMFIRFKNEAAIENKAIINRDRKVITIAGKEVKEPLTTTLLDTKNFGIYIDLVSQYVWDFERIKCIDPNDQNLTEIINFYEQYI